MSSFTDTFKTSYHQSAMSSAEPTTANITLSFVLLGFAVYGLKCAVKKFITR